MQEDLILFDFVFLYKKILSFFQKNVLLYVYFFNKMKKNETNNPQNQAKNKFLARMQTNAVMLKNNDKNNVLSKIQNKTTTLSNRQKQTTTLTIS